MLMNSWNTFGNTKRIRNEWEKLGELHVDEMELYLYTVVDLDKWEELC